MKNLKVLCVTNKVIKFMKPKNYSIGWVGREKPPKDYLTCNTQNNIFFKEKYYSELTFHYWYWKNKLDTNDESG